MVHPEDLVRSNSPTIRLLICGDIESNPGPTNCNVCAKTIRRNARYVTCNQCKTDSHLKCISQNDRNWLCQACLLSQIPFRNVRDLNESADAREPVTLNIPTECEHLEALKSNGTSIAHLNTKCVTSTFAEFENMLSTYKFDVITLSETWLGQHNVTWSR